MCFSESVLCPASAANHQESVIWRGRAEEEGLTRFNGFAPPNEYVNWAHQNHHPRYYPQSQLLRHSNLPVSEEGSAGVPRGRLEVVENDGHNDQHGGADNEMNTVSTGGGGGGGGGSMGKKSCEDEVMTLFLGFSLFLCTTPHHHRSPEEEES